MSNVCSDKTNYNVFFSVMSMFTHHGEDINALQTGLYQDTTSLHKVAHLGCYKCAERLLRNGVEVNGPNDWGETALNAALQEKHYHLAELLIKYGASVDHRDKHGRTPLIQRAASGDVSGVRFLLNLNEGETGGRDCGRVERCGPIKNGQKCPVGCSLWLPKDDIDKSRMNVKNTQIYEICGANDGGDRNRKITSETIMTSVGDFHLLRKPSFKTMFKSRANFDCYNPVQKFMSETKSSGKCDRDDCEKRFTSEITGAGLSPDDRASNRLNAEIRTQPLVDINACDNIGRTALIHAVKKRHLKVVETLLEHGADVNLATPRGDTALLQAIELVDKAIFTALLAHGADLNSINCYTFTELTSVALYVKSSSPPMYLPPQHTSLIDRQEMVRALLSRGLDLRKLIGYPSHRCVSVYQSSVLQVALECGLLRDFSSLWRLRVTIDTLNQEPYRYVTFFTRAELINCLAHYIVKLSAAGLFKLPQKHCFFDEVTEDIEDTRVLCEAEVAEMDDVIPGSSVTYLEVLRKDVDQLARLSRNRSVVEALRGVEGRFPLYAGMLKGRLERGLQRREVVEAATPVCQRIFAAWQVPYEVTESVVTRLDDVNLRRFLNDVKGDPVLKNFVVEENCAGGDFTDFSPCTDEAVVFDAPSEKNLLNAGVERYYI